MLKLHLQDIDVLQNPENPPIEVYILNVMLIALLYFPKQVAMITSWA
jgi:hypothetical protein